MGNENKWEYDYSASNNETGYPNVGSSGMNTANQYNEPEAQPARPADTAPADGGSVPPIPPEQPQYSAPAQPEKPRRKKKFNGGKLARSAVALVLEEAEEECRQGCKEHRRSGAGRSHGLCRRLCGRKVRRQW